MREIKPVSKRPVKNRDPMEAKVQMNVYVPFWLRKDLDDYLHAHPEKSLSKFVEVAIRRELMYGEGKP
jgi:hypothetical protein